MSVGVFGAERNVGHILRLRAREAISNSLNEAQHSRFIMRASIKIITSSQLSGSSMVIIPPVSTVTYIVYGGGPYVSTTKKD